MLRRKVTNETQQAREENELQETLDFTKPAYSFIPTGIHEYRQAGPYLVCKSCEVSHAVFIGMERIMVGVTEKGYPILKKRKEIGM